MWSVELGLRSGVVYEHPISKHFSMRYNVGFITFSRLEAVRKGQNGATVSTDEIGVLPYVMIGTRWYPSVNDNNSGFYLGVNARYDHKVLSFGNPILNLDELQQAGILELSIGYAHSLTEHLSIKSAVFPGVSIYMNRRTNNMSSLAVFGLDLGLTYSF